MTRDQQHAPPSLDTIDAFFARLQTGLAEA